MEALQERGCDNCKHCGEWVMQTPLDRKVRPYELATCNSQNLPEHWRVNGPLYVMHGCGFKCFEWEAKK